MSANNESDGMASILEENSESDIKDNVLHSLKEEDEEMEEENEETEDMNKSECSLDVDSETGDVSEKTKKVTEDDPDTDLELEPEKPEFDSTMRGQYLYACKHLGIVPCSYFLRHMTDSELKLRHHGLGKLGAKAISLPMQSNTSTLTLDLHDNWLEGEGGEAIALMLEENCYISTLDMSDNRLGRRGIKAVCNMLMQNTVIQTLNLSGNGVSDHDAQAMADAINENNRIKLLDLSHNELSEKAGNIIGPAIAENETIDHLNVSWNYFRRTSAVKLCEGISENMGLRIVNLSMNGFDDDVAFAIADIIKKHHALLNLDVSYNRMSNTGAVVIGKALEVNDVLKTFKIGHNRIGIEGAKALLKGISSSNSIISKFDISGVEVDKEFLKMVKDLNTIRPVKVTHGVVLSNFIIKKRLPKSEGDSIFFDMLKEDVNSSNILELVKQFCLKNQIEVREFLEEKMEKAKAVVEISVFLSCLKSAGLLLNKDQAITLENLLSECADQNRINVSCFLE